MSLPMFQEARHRLARSGETLPMYDDFGGYAEHLATLKVGLKLRHVTERLPQTCITGPMYLCAICKCHWPQDDPPTGDLEQMGEHMRAEHPGAAAEVFG